MRGVVKWFNKKLGYGYILGEDNKQIFAHYSDIQSKDKYKKLNIGSCVTYDIGKDTRTNKQCAVNICEEKVGD